MSVLSEKQNVFEQISVLKTASELSLNGISVKNNIFSAFASSKVKNNNDPFLFIVDLLTILAGSAAVTGVITTMFSSMSKVENSYKGSLVMEVQAANGGANANPPMPANLASGMQVHINKLDFSQDLMTPPTSTANGLMLDCYKQNLQTIMKTPNTTMPLDSMTTASYNNQTGFFTVHPVNSSLSYNQFMSGVISNTKFIDPKILMNQTLDSVFNTQGKTKTQISTDAQIDLLLNNLVSEIEEDDSYFTFDTHDLNDIEAKMALSDQLYTEVGCGRVAVNMTIDDVATVASAVTFPVSTKVVETALANATSIVTNSASSPNLAQSDIQSVSNNFLSKFMAALKSQIVKNFITSPQMNMIYALSQSFTPNTDTTYDPIGDLKARRALIACMIKKLINELLADIFNLVKKELLEIVSAVAVLYAQEGIERYAKILKSLI